LRLSGALAMAGVLFAVPVPGVKADTTEPLVRFVLCCFCGELCADGRAFLGELMEDEGCCMASGLVMDGRALEYRVLPCGRGHARAAIREEAVRAKAVHHGELRLLFLDFVSQGFQCVWGRCQ
jgi:hypothetical protein